MVSLREVDSNVLRMAMYFDEKKNQNGECNVRKFRRFSFFRMSSDVPAFKVPIFANDFKF